MKKIAASLEVVCVYIYIDNIIEEIISNIRTEGTYMFLVCKNLLSFFFAKGPPSFIGDFVFSSSKLSEEKQNSFARLILNKKI